MEKITPMLWFDGLAEEAANFYVSVFPDSGIDEVMRSPVDTPSCKAGSVLTVAFRLRGEPFVALNGGPAYKFTPAVSFVVHCETQEEVDRYWSRLTEGGEEVACGWLTDKYGLSWQITPNILVEMISDPDQAKAARAMEAMMKMVKIDIAALRAAVDGV